MENDWQRNLCTVKDRISQLLEENCWTDVKFAVGEDLKVFSAHKIILSAASPVFSTMFYGSLPENTDKEIVLGDVQPKIFSKMLKYIYSDSIEFDSYETAFHLYNVAKKYMIDQLEKKCIQYLTYELKPSNALKIYKFAQFFNEKILEDKVLELIKKQTILVLDSDDFADIDIAVMATILEQDKLQTTEYELFRALESLAELKGVFSQDSGKQSEENCKLQESFRNAVKKIQFYSMTLEQFVNGPAMSELLLPAEIRAISACLNKPSKLKILYPKDFAQNVRQSKNLPHVFFDFNIDGSTIGRIVIQLRSDVVPKTVDAFLFNFSESFKGSKITYVSKNCCEVTSEDFHWIKSENYVLKNKESGTVALVLNTYNLSEFSDKHFLITFNKFERLSDNVIGHVVKGMDIVETIESYRNKSNNKPSKEINIGNCGLLKI